jgi:hypothetical protein
MDEVKILQIKQSVDNDRQADELRAELKKKGIFLLNLRNVERIVMWDYQRLGSVGTLSGITRCLQRRKNNG